jgi:putative ABC transport system permease protein
VLLLAWRNFTQSRTQFFLGLGGVTLAFVLMLALDALLAGSARNLVAYIEQSGADVIVAQDGVRNMHMSASSLSWRDLRLAGLARGVTRASPILYTSAPVKAGPVDVLAYIIGFDPDEPLGGPRTVVSGTLNLLRGQALMDEAVTRAQGLRVGDTVEVLGASFAIAGITRGLTNIVNSVTFIRLDEFQRLQGTAPVSYGLVAVAPGFAPEQVAAAITARNGRVLALTRAEFAQEERQIVQDMSAEVLVIMNAAGLAMGLAVTALTLYTATLRKRQEYGVLKAVGAGNRYLYGIIAAQTCMSLVLGLAAALTLVAGLGILLPMVAPGANLLLTTTGVTRALWLSLLIGLVAALAPAWQLAHLDPIQVFRKAG